jgi:hypothetical protein
VATPAGVTSKDGRDLSHESGQGFRRGTAVPEREHLPLQDGIGYLGERELHVVMTWGATALPGSGFANSANSAGNLVVDLVRGGAV